MSTIINSLDKLPMNTIVQFLPYSIHYTLVKKDDVKIYTVYWDKLGNIHNGFFWRNSSSKEYRIKVIGLNKIIEV